ncbi:MAG TPA: hypothetical protein V6C86_22220 [Oculatellaceae cyanobacterium]
MSKKAGSHYFINEEDEHQEHKAGFAHKQTYSAGNLGLRRALRSLDADKQHNLQQQKP